MSRLTSAGLFPMVQQRCSARKEREPMKPRPQMSRHALLMAVATLGLVSGCTSATSASPSVASTEPARVTAVTTAVTLPTAVASAVEDIQVEPVDDVLRAEVTPEGILAAAVIIVSDGDLEAAIIEGLISEAEAETALRALETGTLDSLL